MTAIIPCDCKHAYQDAAYGKNQRVHNFAKSTAKGGGWRCTVCGKMKDASAAKVEQQ